VSGKRLRAEVQESIARRLQRRVGPSHTLDAVARMASVVQVVEVVGQTGKLRKRLGPEVVELKVLLARREDFVQKTIGATLLEILSYKRTILGVMLDRIWGYVTAMEDRQSSPRQRSPAQLRQGGFELSLDRLVELRFGLVQARLQTLQLRRLRFRQRRAELLVYQLRVPLTRPLFDIGHGNLRSSSQAPLVYTCSSLKGKILSRHAQYLPNWQRHGHRR
jgi:hypothetical protein